jgi:hypothetical protein
MKVTRKLEENEGKEEECNSSREMWKGGRSAALCRFNMERYRMNAVYTRESK